MRAPNPIAIVLGLTTLWLASLSASEPAAPAPTAAPEPAFVYVGMNGQDRPFLDFEGEGMVVEHSVRQAKPGDDFELALVVIDLDPTREVYVAGMDVSDRTTTRLRAKVTRTGKDAFALRGSLEVQGPVRVQFVQMQRAGSDDSFPELGFDPGSHSIAFDATIVGWLEL